MVLEHIGASSTTAVGLRTCILLSKLNLRCVSRPFLMLPKLLKASAKQLRPRSGPFVEVVRRFTIDREHCVKLPVFRCVLGAFGITLWVSFIL